MSQALGQASRGPRGTAPGDQSPTGKPGCAIDGAGAPSCGPTAAARAAATAGLGRGCSGRRRRSCWAKRTSEHRDGARMDSRHPRSRCSIFTRPAAPPGRLRADAHPDFDLGFRHRRRRSRPRVVQVEEVREDLVAPSALRQRAGREYGAIEGGVSDLQPPRLAVVELGQRSRPRVGLGGALRVHRPNTAGVGAECRRVGTKPCSRRCATFRARTWMVRTWAKASP